MDGLMPFEELKSQIMHRDHESSTRVPRLQEMQDMISQPFDAVRTWS
jgi:hypothetical protein